MRPVYAEKEARNALVGAYGAPVLAPSLVEFWHLLDRLSGGGVDGPGLSPDCYSAGPQPRVLIPALLAPILAGLSLDCDSFLWGVALCRDAATGLINLKDK